MLATSSTQRCCEFWFLRRRPVIRRARSARRPSGSGVELVFATDRCHVIDDPWQDQAIPIRFHDEDASVAAIVDARAGAPDRRRPRRRRSADGDRRARRRRRSGLPGTRPTAAAIARNKQRTRERLRDAGLPVPWFRRRRQLSAEPSAVAVAELRRIPCVVKPVALSGSRGVMRADDPASFAAAFERLRALLRVAGDPRRAERGARALRSSKASSPAASSRSKALMHHGALHVLAIFDKPDPLDGPFFEETIYVTPSSAPADVQERDRRRRRRARRRRSACTTVRSTPSAA